SLRAQFTCTAASSGVPSIAGESVSRLVADVIVTCTGGLPTDFGVAIPTFNFQIALNTTITSRLLAVSPDWSEALLLIDEPPPGSQFPCDQATGVCLAYGNG